VPFPYLLYILLIWLGISAPLVLLGCRLVHIPFSYPCKSARIPKPLVTIPGQFKLRALSILAGSLPFGCMFIELNYVMQSLWHHSLFYYLFGFLLLCFLVLVITSAEVSILLTYLLLCKEDPRWWWWSFGVSANSGLYFFLYSCVYFFTELGVTRFSGIVLYFGYMLLGSVTYALITGCVGFWATFFFIRAIYSLIRVD
jgi:transmembrane 9 superfamily protein 2/4